MTRDEPRILFPCVTHTNTAGQTSRRPHDPGHRRSRAGHRDLARTCFKNTLENHADRGFVDVIDPPFGGLPVPAIAGEHERCSVAAGNARSLSAAQQPLPFGLLCRWSF